MQRIIFFFSEGGKTGLEFLWEFFWFPESTFAAERLRHVECLKEDETQSCEVWKCTAIENTPPSAPASLSLYQCALSVGEIKFKTL